MLAPALFVLFAMAVFAVCFGPFLALGLWLENLNWPKLFQSWNKESDSAMEWWGEKLTFGWL